MSRSTIYRSAGPLMLGSRLKLLGEKLVADVGRLYRQEELPFEPSWFPLFFLLQGAETVTVSEVARGLGITDSGASQLVRGVQKRGLVSLQSDGPDRRVRHLRLTAAGRELLDSIQPVWSALRRSLVDLCGDEGALGRLAATLDELEDRLAEQDLTARLAGHLERQRLAREVILCPLEPPEYESWRRLMLDWLVAPPGHESIPPPLQDCAAVIEGGGRLLAAWDRDELIGLAAARPLVEGRYELLFLGAGPRRGGPDLERRLLDLLIDELRHEGAAALLAPVIPEDVARLRLLRECEFQLADPAADPPDRERLWLDLDLREGDPS